MAAKNNAKLPDVKTLVQAGIDPRTGLPLKVVGSEPEHLKEQISNVIQLIDEQDAVNRFTWYNLPDGLDGELLERILYYKGQGMFFYIPSNDQFLFLPYALDGTIDVYGRYKGVTPLPFGGSTNGKKPWIQGLTREPMEHILTETDLLGSRGNEVTEATLSKALGAIDALRGSKCVLLHDYAKGLSETITPRCSLNRGLIETEAECIPFMRTALLASTGVAGMRVQDESEQSNVKAASRSVVNSALTGEKWIPIVGSVDFQDLVTGNVAQSQEFMQAMNSIDTLRLSTMGLSNGGLMVEKSQYMNETETAAGGVNSGLILNDGLRIRQEFCNRVNSLWNLGIWCEVTQPMLQGPAMSQAMTEQDPEQYEGQSAEQTGGSQEGGNE